VKTPEKQHEAYIRWRDSRTESQAQAIKLKQGQGNKARRAADLTHAKQIAARSRLKHQEQRRQDCRDWRNNHKSDTAAYNRKWHEQNRDHHLLLNVNWQRNNRDRVTARHNERYCQDPQFRMQVLLRGRLRQALQRKRLLGYKSKSAARLTGCSMEFLIEHLEAHFQEGMTWKNFGAWHIDHIRPVDSFDLTDAKQQVACFHYSNLQPLWAIDNLRKGNRTPTEKDLTK
jgi:hypothetical protein